MDSKTDIQTHFVTELGEAVSLVSTRIQEEGDLYFRGQASHLWGVSSSLSRAISGDDEASSSPHPYCYYAALSHFAKKLIMLGSVEGTTLANKFFDCLEGDTGVMNYAGWTWQPGIDQNFEWQAPSIIRCTTEVLYDPSPIECSEEDRRVFRTFRRFESIRDELASLAQHYGMPTHLIDLSSSIVIAAGMAAFDRNSNVQNNERPCIYVLSKSKIDAARFDWFDRLFVQAAIEDSFDEEGIQEAFGRRIRNAYNLQTFLRGAPLRWVDLPNPLNEHQRSQRGVLLSIAPCETLESLLGLWAPEQIGLVHKIIFDCSHSELRKQCRLFGIDPSSMFHTIRGAALEAREALYSELGSP